MNINLFTLPQGSSEAPGSSTAPVLSPPGPFRIACPGCTGDLYPIASPAGWQTCPFCRQKMQIRAWPTVRESARAASAMPDQATCFFHPDKAFQACCHRCGRFVCALCDLQVGSEHVCPTCFERGRGEAAAGAGKAEWRHRDVLYDSIALVLGWGWILVWPLVVVAFPAAVFLHIRFRKAPRSFLIPRSGWRFWMAYVGFAWLPLLLASAYLIPRISGSR